MSRGVLPYISHIGMCGPDGYIYILAVLVWKRVYILPILVWNRVSFSMELRECMNVFVISVPKWILSWGRVIYKFEVDRVTIWRTSPHTPQGAHTIFVCNHNLKISNLTMRLKDFPFFVHKKSTGYRRLFVLKTQCSFATSVVDNNCKTTVS